VVEAVSQPDPFQKLGRLGPDPPAARQVRPEAVADHQRHHHVLQRRELWEQVVELEDEAERFVAEFVTFDRRQIVNAPAIIMDGPLVG
jgi:hypothetical protein